MTKAVPRNWLQTASGLIFDLDNPRSDLVRIEDIAHGLSNLCRFGGHCREFYSVAQHSTLAASECFLETGNPLWALCVHLHDASEAYVVDVPRPVKRILGPVYTDLETRVQAAILQTFGLETIYGELEYSGIIKQYDNRMLMTEKRDLLNHDLKWTEADEPFSSKICVDTPSAAKYKWIDMFNSLFRLSAGRPEINRTEFK